MGWEIMALSLVFYGIVLLFIWPSPLSKPVRSGPLGKSGIFLHNLILMVYSMLVLYETLPILASCVEKHGSLYDAVSVELRGIC